MKYPLIESCLTKMNRIPKGDWPVVASSACVSYGWLTKFVYAKGETDYGYKRLLRLEVAAKLAIRDARKEEKMLSLGITSEEWDRFRSMAWMYSKTPIAQYEQQKVGAARRKVEWGMTLLEWWDIWDSSGRYPERGSGGDGYCMCRHGDIGGYTPGNVYIATGKQNIKDGQRFRRDRAIVAKKSTKLALALANKTHKWLAGEIDASPSQLSRWLEDEYIKNSFVERIAAVFDMSLSEFLALGE